MSFNCSSLTHKQLYVIQYMQNTENTLFAICTIILLINFVITDDHGYTPLEILGKTLRNFMHLNSSVKLESRFTYTGVMFNNPGT